MDNGGKKKKGLVEIYKLEGKYYGRIAHIYRESEQTAICANCQGERKEEPLLGMTIITDLEPIAEGQYSGGKVVNTNSGRLYDMEMELVDSNTLRVHAGYHIAGRVRGVCQMWRRHNIDAE